MRVVEESPYSAARDRRSRRKNNRYRPRFPLASPDGERRGSLCLLIGFGLLAGLALRDLGGVAWCVSGRGYAPPSDTPRGLFPNSLMSTGTETGKGSMALGS